MYVKYAQQQLGFSFGHLAAGDDVVCWPLAEQVDDLISCFKSTISTDDKNLLIPHGLG